MNYEVLKQKHQAELEAFHQTRTQHQIDLWNAEMDIVEAVGMEQSNIPNSLRQRLDYDWRLFEQQYGVNSEAYKSLVQKQQNELAQFRQSMMVGFQENGNDITQHIIDFEELKVTDKEWEELQHDHKAIEDYYKAHKRPIPKATQNRMKRHIEHYKESRGIPYEPDESIHPKSEKELALYLDVHDIYEADYAVAQTYEIPPDSTNDRFRLDLHDHFMAFESYHDLKYQNSLMGKLASKYLQWKERKQSKSIIVNNKDTRRAAFKKEIQPQSMVDNSRQIDIE